MIPEIGELLHTGKSHITIGRDGNSLTLTMPLPDDMVAVSYMTPDAALDFATAIAVAAAVIVGSKEKSN